MNFLLDGSYQRLIGGDWRGSCCVVVLDETFYPYRDQISEWLFDGHLNRFPTQIIATGPDLRGFPEEEPHEVTFQVWLSLYFGKALFEEEVWGPLGTRLARMVLNSWGLEGIYPWEDLDVFLVSIEIAERQGAS